MNALIDYKNEFSERGGIHFNNAGMAPISKRVSERLKQLVNDSQVRGSLIDSEWVPEIKKTREQIARFLGATIDQIALTANCAQGLSQTALGYPLKKTDSVVTIDQEYASNFYPWQVACGRSGANLVVVPSDSHKQIQFEKLIAAIHPGVKLVGVSWVQFQTGSMLNLKTLGDHCHSVGAYLVVDGIQGLGQIPFSFQDLPVDAIIGASHKWLCGLTGQGFLAAKKDFLDVLNPLAVGSLNFNRFGTFADPHAHLETSARKFEAGGLAYLPLFALGSALSLIEEVGVETISKEVNRLSRLLRKGLMNLPVVELMTPLEQIGGITSFKLPSPLELKFLKLCKEKQVALAKRGEFVRISLHAFCNDQEVSTVLELLASL